MKRLIITAVSLILAAAICACAPINTARTNINEMLSRINGEEEQEEASSEKNGNTETLAEQSNTFNIGIVNIDTWNPLLTQSATVREAMEFVYDTLFEVNTRHEAVPVLAKDYSVSPDGKTVNVNLKPDVLWHDGGHFDSYDVVYTVNLIMGGGTAYGNLLQDVASCERTGSNSVRFRLHRSVPDFPAVLTFPIIKYKTSMEYNANTAPVGTGPFSFYGKVSTDKYLLVRYGSYHNGAADIDAVNIIEVPDNEKYRLMFEASEIDVVTDSIIDIINGMPKGNIKVKSYTTNKMTYIGYNTASPILSGAQTRRGISMLIDRDEIVSSVLYSKAKAAVTPINPSSYLYYDTTERFGIDYEEAYSEFEGDGWHSQEQGFTRTKNGSVQKLSVGLLVNSDDAIKVRTAEKVKETLERFGVSVTLDKRGGTEYQAKLNAHDFDLFIGEVELNPNNDLTSLTDSWNYFSYSNPDVNTIIAQSGMTTDSFSRQQLFIQLCEQLKKDMPFAAIYFADGCVISGNKIKSGIEPTVSSNYRVANLWRVK
ncbi:MAG: ABC transporter substrate-binding protein [bacterium]|nr:ABC transporter substrate-binding protein [bacterium]